ncbi:expressed unknown protein [Seminavis robusta]|uniref:Small VCP/p97-interacting protein n=1 Tax=Seminavis robusta TaxID=568900 RepID=A0A9N8EWJ0_9STRA|nr:expressed unknown protein [Seminavis robusta]|eukprot:Sro1909_g304830.1 n/a (106) ;mRNA; r:13345-13769
MGNCCEKGGGANPSAFQGEGHRLGSVDDARPTPTTPLTAHKDAVPEPVYDDNLTPEERERQRAARAAAAEKRFKDKGGTKPKKKDTSGQPLRGPNTQNTMRWNAG